MMKREELNLLEGERKICSGQENAAYERNILKLIIYRAFMFSLALVVPTLVIYWREAGIGLFEVMMLQAIFATGVVVLEVPSGYLADVLGRRGTLVVAAFFYMCSPLIYARFPNFWAFAVGELFMAVAMSLVSGADQAFLYDSLAAARREKEFAKLLGTLHLCEMILTAIFSVLGGIFSAIFGFTSMFYCAALGFLVSIMFGLSLVEPPKKQIKKQSIKGHCVDLLSLGKECLVDNAEIRWQMLFSGLMFTFMQGALWLYQPYWETVGIGMEYFGVCFAVLNIFNGIVAKYAHLISKKVEFGNICIVMVLLLFVSYLGMSHLLIYWGASFALLQQAVRGTLGVVFSERLNNKIGSEYRATIVSIQSMVWRLCHAIFLFPLGYVAEKYGVLSALNFIGISAAVLGLGLLSLRPRPAETGVGR